MLPHVCQLSTWVMCTKKSRVVSSGQHNNARQDGGSRFVPWGDSRRKQHPRREFLCGELYLQASCWACDTRSVAGAPHDAPPPPLLFPPQLSFEIGLCSVSQKTSREDLRQPFSMLSRDVLICGDFGEEKDLVSDARLEPVRVPPPATTPLSRYRRIRGHGVHTYTVMTVYL